jgi:hypothetical protein
MSDESRQPEDRMIEAAARAVREAWDSDEVQRAVKAPSPGYARMQNAMRELDRALGASRG